MIATRYNLRSPKNRSSDRGFDKAIITQKPLSVDRSDRRLVATTSRKFPNYDRLEDLRLKFRIEFYSNDIQISNQSVVTLHLENGIEEAPFCTKHHH